MTPNGEYYHCKHVTGMTAGSCLKCLAERQSNQSDNNRANPPKPRAKLGQSRADNAMACDHKMTEPGMDGNTYCINCTGRVLRLGNAMAGELRLKEYIEANLLDGDAIQAGQMIASTEVYAVMADYIAAERTRLLESLQRELPEKRTIDNDHDYTDNTFNKGVNHAIQEVNQLLTKYVQGGENGENNN